MLTLNLTFSFCSDSVGQEEGSVFRCHLQLNFRFSLLGEKKKKLPLASFKYFVSFAPYLPLARRTENLLAIAVKGRKLFKV